MPMISDAQIARLQDDKARDQRTISNLRSGRDKKTMTKQGFAVLEAAGAASVVGFIRGTIEKSGRPFAIPNTPVDIEALVALGLLGSAVFGAWGKYNEDVLHAGLGVIGHYSGQLARGVGAGRPFSPIVGMLPQHTGGIGMLPTFDPTFVGRGGSAESELAAALARSAA